MNEYDDETLQTFLNQQSRLFERKVATTLEEAEAFLEDCMAVVCENLKEVRAYFEESGTDISELGDTDLAEAAEVFPLSAGRYLIVET
jgi:hypothetical protein